MSIFQRTTVSCPACDGEVVFDLAVSVSADRRLDLREALPAGPFHREPCPLCRAASRVEPEFTYLDLGRERTWNATRLGYAESTKGLALAS